MSTHTLKLHKLAVGQESFAWDGEVFEFSDIKSMRFRWNRTTNYVNAVKYETKDDAFLEIGVSRNNTTLVIRVGKGVVAALCGDGAYKEECEQLFNIHRILATKSFDHRLGLYRGRLEQNGYFKYGDVQFYPDGRVRSGDREASINECSVEREPYLLHIRKPQTGVKKALWEFRLWDSDIHIVTEIDQDIIYAMLHALYGLRWT